MTVTVVAATEAEAAAATAFNLPVFVAVSGTMVMPTLGKQASPIQIVGAGSGIVNDGGVR